MRINWKICLSQECPHRLRWKGHDVCCKELDTARVVGRARGSLTRVPEEAVPPWCPFSAEQVVSQ